MRRILSHLRHNLVGYLALFIALGGTGYAATNSTHQVRGQVAAARRPSTKPGGYILAWAHVGANGQIQGGSRGVRLAGGDTNGEYHVTWRGLKIPGGCGVIASASFTGPTGAKSAVATIIRPVEVLGLTSLVFVAISNAQGQGVPAPSTVEVVC